MDIRDGSASDSTHLDAPARLASGSSTACGPQLDGAAVDLNGIAGIGLIIEMFQRQARRLEGQLLKQLQDRKTLAFAQSQLSSINSHVQRHTQTVHEHAQRLMLTEDTMQQMKAQLTLMNSDHQHVTQLSSSLYNEVTQLCARLRHEAPDRLRTMRCELSDVTLRGVDGAACKEGEQPEAVELGLGSSSSTDSSTDSSSGAGGHANSNSSDHTRTTATLGSGSPRILETGGTPHDEGADSGSNSRAASDDREAMESEVASCECGAKARRRSYEDMMADTDGAASQSQDSLPKTMKAEFEAAKDSASAADGVQAEASKSKVPLAKSPPPWYSAAAAMPEKQAGLWPLPERRLPPRGGLPASAPLSLAPSPGMGLQPPHSATPVSPWGEIPSLVRSPSEVLLDRVRAGLQRGLLPTPSSIPMSSNVASDPSLQPHLTPRLAACLVASLQPFADAPAAAPNVPTTIRHASPQPSLLSAAARGMPSPAPATANPLLPAASPQGQIAQGQIAQGQITQGQITQGQITQGQIMQGQITLPPGSAVESEDVSNPVPQNTVWPPVRLPTEVPHLAAEESTSQQDLRPSHSACASASGMPTQGVLSGHGLLLNLPPQGVLSVGTMFPSVDAPYIIQPAALEAPSRYPPASQQPAPR